MDDTLIYRKIELEELNLDLFRKFERRQNVARQLQKQGGCLGGKAGLSGGGMVKEEDYEFLLTCLQNTIQEGGVVFGAFEGNAVKALPRSPEALRLRRNLPGSHKPSCLKRASGPGTFFPSAPAGLFHLAAGHGQWADRNSTSPPIRAGL